VKAAVLGSPVAHSLSPVLHRAAYRELGLTGWSYQAIECDAARLPGLLAQCGPDWAGLSLTMPLKRVVLPLLDRVEPLAAAVGAVNTVVFAGGRRDGHNTDVPGMAAALAAGLRGAGRSSLAGPVLILGAGATACSALAAVGEFGCREVTVAARDPARADGLLAAAVRLAIAVRIASYDDPGVPEPGLLICTVPAGGCGLHAQRIAGATLRPRLVLDVAYHPWPTPLAAAAHQAGIRVVSGFELLVQQAAGQVALMTGQPAPVAAMRAAGLAALAGETAAAPNPLSRRCAGDARGFVAGPGIPPVPGMLLGWVLQQSGVHLPPGRPLGRRVACWLVNGRWLYPAGGSFKGRPDGCGGPRARAVRGFLLGRAAGPAAGCAAGGRGSHQGTA
jgi:shikimate dehydrogenase